MAHLTIRQKMAGLLRDPLETKPRENDQPQLGRPSEISQEDRLNELVERFLKPSPIFKKDWLDIFQQPPSIEPAPLYSDLYDTPASATRSSIKLVRSGIEGTISGYEEYTTPSSSTVLNAKSSSSFTRQPAGKSTFVLGRSGFMPFAPGGMDAAPAGIDSYNSGFFRKDENGLFNLAPGLTRGLAIATQTKADDIEVASSLLTTEEEDIEAEGVELSAAAKPVEPVNEIATSGQTADAEGIDDLLPTETINPLFSAQFNKGADLRNRRDWAHVVDVNTEITNFNELVPKMAREWPFELDTFQKEAVYHLEQGDSVFVAAHTSAGKTVVAEYAIAMAERNMTKAIYTSPIKALSNQKFRDFRHVFEDVGILTGDVQINPEASCLIMTTEILRSMLYRGADIIRDVEFVIFDEVHYVNDLERGVVWEEVIIMLPDHVKLILLSATVPNTYEFASWVGRTKKKDIYVISTPKRPVPLEHFLWAKNKTFKIVDEKKKFLMKGWSDAVKALNPEKPDQSAVQKSGRGGAAAGRGGQLQRGGRGGNQRGGALIRGGPSNRGGRGGSGNRGNFRNNNMFDRNIWLHLVQYLKKQNLQPVVIFVFSKKRCEEYADSLSSLDFCTASEKSQIHVFIKSAISRLKKDDQTLPQILRMTELLSRGVAVHHGGLLPIVKELVEILFAKMLVKVLFATETFAMGLNLPTKTVVFSGIRKHDGRSFRNLLAGEYTQMAGRAGRRGLDTTGTVIITFAGDQPPDVASLEQMMLGSPTKLQSQFRLTYNMILNLLRVEALKVEEMIKRSFSENATQSMIPEHEMTVKEFEANLKNFKREPCDICENDLDSCHDALIECQSLMEEMIVNAADTSVGRRLLSENRLAIIQMKNSARTICLLVGINTQTKEFRGYCLKATNSKQDLKQANDIIPFVPEVQSLLGSIRPRGVLTEVAVPFSAVEYISNTKVNLGEDNELFRGTHRTVKALTAALMKIDYTTWSEVDWSKIRSFKFIEALEKRMKVRETLKSPTCVKCKSFLRHFTSVHEEYLLKKNITELKEVLSDQNLELLPDYEQRIEVLKELGFIDANQNVELKGRVACEINNSYELILTEIILDNLLGDFEPEEIAALLSAFVFREKTNAEPGMVTAKLKEGQERIHEIAQKINTLQESHQILLLSSDDANFDSEPNFGLMEVVYEWAKGMPFNNITNLTDVLEGTIVRVITQLDEVCRQVKSAARIIGDFKLHTKMEKCQEKIKRDIIFCTSLYL
ncbi:NUC185 domain-containing protein [Dipodascopsis tothii]|uniref:NUC185 domain-containing protein n=1 Tax=Dipodascopsis tothii TaxID=44089 RepID=UPI0034CD2D2E